MVAGELLGLLAWHLILTALPAVAASAVAARRGVGSVPVLLAIALAAGGAAAMLGFWTFYADPIVGKGFSILVVIVSVVAAAWGLSGRHIDRAVLVGVGTPLALWALGSAFLLMLGFLHGGTETPLATATTRFSHPLPGDNDIPNFFATWFYFNGHHGTPPVYPGEWLSSDRPPLQVGYQLLQRPFAPDTNGLNYQVLGVVLQQLWIVGLWALLVAARVNRLTRGLTMIVVLVSDLAIVNGFFVWPKLLPAAMLLAVAALVLSPLLDEIRRSLWGAALVAGLCALAMMGHGSSVFGIVPLALVAIYRGLPSWRWIGVGLAVGVVLMGSWSAYQKYGDPPGDRLTKWTLASVIEVDGRSTTEAIEDSYSEAGFGGAVENKAENFEEMIGGRAALDTLEEALRLESVESVIRDARAIGFYYLLPSLGLLLLGPLAMVVGFRRRRQNRAEWRFALTCFAVLAIGAVIWGLLIFGGQEDLTVIHVGSYLLPLLAMSGCVAGLRASFPCFAVGYLGFAALLWLIVYVPSFEPPAGTSYSGPIAIVAALALCAFAALALGAERLRRPGLPPGSERSAAQPIGTGGRPLDRC